MGVRIWILGLLSVVVVAKVLFHTVKQLIRWKTFMKLPGPTQPAYPFIGHAMLISGNDGEFYEKVQRILKKEVVAKGHEAGCIWMGPLPVVFVVGPNAARVILSTTKHTRKSYFYTLVEPWLKTGLLTSNGPKWKSRRRFLTPTFHFSILQDFLAIMNEQAEILTTKLEKYSNSEEIFNVFQPITLCALDIICNSAMGKPLHAQENKDSEYVSAIYRISGFIIDRMLSPWLWSNFGYNYVGKGKDHNRAVNILHEFTRSVIKERMNDISVENPSSIKKKPLAFLDLLISISDGGKVLSLDDIQEEVDTFMFAGHDTTASAMSWAIHLIGSHSDVQRKIQEELDEVLGVDPEHMISVDDLRKLIYLEMVIKESLRIFSSVPLIGRTTTSDCIIDGHHIPKGTDCLLMIHMVNNNPNYWPEPDRFDPERFNLENSATRHPYAFVSFAAGPRNCIGQRFALMEEKVVLAHLFRKFSVTSIDKTEEIRLVGDIILRPRHGMNIRITKRMR